MNMMMFYTIPRLARTLGVSATAMRYWVDSGWVPAPQHIDNSSTAVYTADEAREIEAFYLKRAVAGMCRGSGAEDKQRRALARLRERAEHGPMGQRSEALGVNTPV